MIFFWYYQSKIWQTKTASWPYHLNLQQSLNLKYHIYASYFVHVLKGNIMHTFDKKVLNMRHQAKKGSCGIFVGIPQHQQRLSCVRTKYKEDNIFVSCWFLWKFSSASQLYKKAMATRLSMKYTPCATFSKDKMAI